MALLAAVSIGGGRRLPGLPRASALAGPAPKPVALGKLLHGRFRAPKVLNGHRFFSVFCVAFDHTGRFLVTGADDTFIKVRGP